MTIHLTVDLEDSIRRELDRLRRRPAVSDEDVGRIAALMWVLEQAGLQDGISGRRRGSMVSGT